MISDRSLLLSLLALAACAGSSVSSGRADTNPGPRAPSVDWDTAGTLTRSIPCDTPVVIHASDDQRGVRAEYAFLRKHYPGYQRGDQLLGESNGRHVDIIDLTAADGAKYSVCFDINSFYGRL